MPEPVPSTVLAALATAVERLDARLAAQDERLTQILAASRLSHDDDRGLRRALGEARSAPSYEQAYRAPAPLVSVIVPTWNNAAGLRERSLPSALAQTYPNLEIVVVGDASPPEVQEAVASFGDDRIRFHNRTVRGPYPSDPRQAWLSSGTPTYNEAAAQARGSWIAPLADDDRWHPDAVERLLRHARSRRLEFVHGQFALHWPDGRREVLGRSPPEQGQIALQASIYHAGLRCFELELGDAAFDVPNDWGMIRRMLRAGVRAGMLEGIVAEYFPSEKGMALHDERMALAASTPVAAPVVAALIDRIQELETALETLRHRLDGS